MRRSGRWLRIGAAALLCALLGVTILLFFSGTPGPASETPSTSPGAHLGPDALRLEGREDGSGGSPDTRLSVGPRRETGAQADLVWRVRGRVTDVGGRAVPDAEVVLAQVAPESEDTGDVRVRTRTGADGSYRLSMPDGGRLAADTFVSATAPDHGALSHFPSLAALPIDAEGVVLADLVLYPVGTVRVRVLDGDGVPVPGAEVMVWARWPAGGTATRTFPCDAEGRCTLPGLFGTIGCRARAPGHRGDGSHLRTVPIGGVLQMDLRVIRAGAGLRLRCVDPEGRPVSELGVVAGASRDFDEGTAVEGITDGDGRVTLAGFAPDDQVRVRVRDGGAPWCCDPSVGDLAVGDLAAPPEVTILLLPGSIVRGLVRAETGETVGPGYPLSITARGVRRDAVTDAAGRVVFDSPLPVGPARVDASRMPDALRVELTAGACELDLVVTPCVRVEVRLLRPDGTPLRGRWPRVAGKHRLSLGLEAESGEPSERYALDLEPGAHGVLSAWAPAAFVRRSRVVLRTVGPASRALASSSRIGPIRTGSTARVDLVVPPDLLPGLRGRLLLAGSSTPCFSGLLQLTPLDAQRAEETRHAFFFATDRFELAFVLPGRYELLLHAEGRTAKPTITVPDAGILDLGDIVLEAR